MKDACPDYEAHLCQGRRVIGVDEVGRGPLAGPVVAAAAYLPDTRAVSSLRDSKALTEKRRLVLNKDILACASVAFGSAPATTIDELGIEQATRQAMQNAVAALVAPSDAVVLVDGNRAPTFGNRDVITEIKADGSCPSVAAAAIVAKTVRDRAMVNLAHTFGAYGWHTNKGYGSKQHREAIREHGVTPHHRHSFLGKILAD